jgi:hypothetical protein
LKNCNLIIFKVQALTTTYVTLIWLALDSHDRLLSLNLKPWSLGRLVVGYKINTKPVQKICLIEELQLADFKVVALTPLSHSYGCRLTKILA